MMNLHPDETQDVTCLNVTSRVTTPGDYILALYCASPVGNSPGFTIGDLAIHAGEGPHLGSLLVVCAVNGSELSLFGFYPSGATQRFTSHSENFRKISYDDACLLPMKKEV